ncbi:MAG TPA: hypothetical protein VJO32_02630 [Ktedonobacteraceae bacterium]|nr:hypothetical protein [Ktedonobacteraceae bacterium]
MNALISTTVNYRFVQHTRRITRLALISAIVLLLAVAAIVLDATGALPAGLGGLGIIGYLVGVIAFVVLMPMLILSYEYARCGLWVDDEGTRVRFPGEKLQEIAWSEARFAVNEGEEYLQFSKGKEGLGHIFGDTRYIRLHLEGLTPEQREQAIAAIAQHCEMRHPTRFTLMTLLNTRGETIARGRLYLFERELVCAENRGEKRVFFIASLAKLTGVRKRDPFYVGKLEFEALSLRYKGTDYVIMLGYETTISGNIGTSSHWAITGYAADWVEALSVSLH